MPSKSDFCVPIDFRTLRKGPVSGIDLHERSDVVRTHEHLSLLRAMADAAGMHAGLTQNPVRMESLCRLRPGYAAVLGCGVANENCSPQRIDKLINSSHSNPIAGEGEAVPSLHYSKIHQCWLLGDSPGREVFLGRGGRPTDRSRVVCLSLHARRSSLLGWHNNSASS